MPLHEKCDWVAPNCSGKFFIDLFRSAPVSAHWNAFLFENLTDAIMTKLRWA